MFPALVFSIPFIFILVRKPVLRRLAFRNATRRPRETALVLLGSLLGTAIITGSLIVGDTLHSSIRRGAFTQLGPVDEVVAANDPATAAEAEKRIVAMNSPDIDGVMPITGSRAAVATAGEDPKAEPQAQVWEIDFARAATFGGDAGATGMSEAGATPAPGHAVIGKDLAKTLDAEAGDKVAAYLYGQQTEVTVDRVLPRMGIAGLNTGQGSASPNLFVAPGTIAALAAKGPAGAAPPSSMVLISNVGGVIAGRSLSVAQGALGDLPVHVSEVKDDVLEQAESTGKEFTQLFQGIGMFSVIAGIALLVNIFVMLAQERKMEMGMLRAVGMRRAALVGSFSLEGWLYALASAALGGIAGIGIGYVVATLAAGIFAQEGGFALEVHFAATPASIQAGFVFGFLISLVTVLGTSIWVSRLNVIRAIRDLPEPENHRTRLISQIFGGVLALVGVMMFMSGMSATNGVPILLGPAFGAIGAYLLLRRSLPRRPLVTATSLSALVWAIVAFSVVPRAFRDAAIPVFVVQGVVLTASAVCLVTVNQDIIGSFVRRLGGGTKNMALRLGLAYPLARRFRTGLILAMYGLVVFTITFVVVISNLFGGQVDDFATKVAGGFDLRLMSNPSNPVPVDAVRARPEVRAVAPLASAGAEFAVPQTNVDFTPWPASTFDAALVDNGPPSLNERGRFPDDLSAYRSLLEPASNDIIVSQFFLVRNSAGPPRQNAWIGSEIVVRDPLSGRTAKLRVSAIAESGFGNALAMIPPHVMTGVFGSRAVANDLFVATKPGTDNESLSAAINGAFLANGADARTFRDQINEILGRQLQFFRLMQGYMALGLLVGIAGLGVVMVRAVRERRRQVGVLRALGFEASAVRRAFVTESAFVSLEGIVIGAGLAVITSWRLMGNGAMGPADMSFHVPWLQVGLLVLGTFLASLIATVAPAQQASKIRPAVALRIAD